MLVLGGLNCFEGPCFRGAGNFPQVWGVVFLCRSSGLVVFAAEDAEVGGPPRVGVVQGARRLRVLLQ